MSFCVPVYNRAEVTRNIVEGLLVSDDPRFEVVLCDNASEENIPYALSQIHDPRLKYYRNDTNIGAFQNWLKALELGDGEYLYLVMGRDRIDGEHISRLIKILEYARENNVTFLNDGYSNKDEIQIFDGIDAMTALVTTIHPTGAIFDREQFKAIPNKSSYFVPEITERINIHPENYLRHALLLHGKGAIIMSGVFHYPDPLIDRSKVKSTAVPLKNLSDMYYSPVRYTREVLDFIDMIDADCPEIFSKDDTDKYFQSKFWLILYLVTFEWRKICADYKWQAHYNQQVRHVGRLEMLRNILTAYRDTKAHLKAQGTFTKKRHNIMYKQMFRLGVYHPVYTRAKKILKPLVIWSVLKFIKHIIKGDTAQN